MHLPDTVFVCGGGVCAGDEGLRATMKNHLKEQNISQISQAIDEKMPGNHAGVEGTRHFFKQLCSEFANSGFADGHYVKEICTNTEKFWQRVSEALFWHQIKQINNIDIVAPRKKSGYPDFHLKYNQTNIFIECVCPEPIGIPEIHLRSGFRGDESIAEYYRLPHEEILLRWTAAIKEKYEKFTKYKNT